MKEKEMVDHEDTEYHEGHVARKRPRKMVLGITSKRKRTKATNGRIDL